MTATPRRRANGEYRKYFASWESLDHGAARAQARDELRRRHKDEFESIANVVHDPRVNYAAAYGERDAVLRERHREEFEELVGDFREKLGLPRYPKSRRLVDRRNGEL